jgi:hypothetical protein
MPTTHRSCDIADIEGAEADEVTLVSPEYAFVVLLVVDVVFEDEPL